MHELVVVTGSAGVTGSATPSPCCGGSWSPCGLTGIP